MDEYPPLGFLVRQWGTYLEIHGHYVEDPIPRSLAVDRVSIAEQEPWGFVVRERFDNLLSSPQSSRIGCDVEMRSAAPFVPQHQGQPLRRRDSQAQKIRSSAPQSGALDGSLEHGQLLPHSEILSRQRPPGGRRP